MSPTAVLWGGQADGAVVEVETVGVPVLPRWGVPEMIVSAVIHTSDDTSPEAPAQMVAVEHWYRLQMTTKGQTRHPTYDHAGRLVYCWTGYGPPPMGGPE